MREPHQRTAVNFAFEPWLAGEPIRSEPAPECLLSMHRVARHVNDHRARDSERTAVFAVAENRASQTARDASGIETWCFRTAIGRRSDEPGDGFVYLVSVAPRVEDRFEWVEVNEVFTTVPASQTQGAMRAWNCQISK